MTAATSSTNEPDSPTSLLVVSNAAAGSNEDGALDEAVEIWREAGLEVEVVATEGREELERALADHRGRTVVAAGGDGSLHAVVQALHDLGEADEVTVGLLPLGTGNDLARGTGVPLDTAEAARALLTAEPRAMDLLVDQDGMVGVNAVNLGIGAAASERAAGLKAGLGPAAYPVGAVAAGATEGGWQLTITVDDRVVVDDEAVLHVVIGNGPSIGGGTNAAPDADPEDHVADVVVSLATGAMARMGYASDLQRGRHVERDDVIRLTGREVVIAGDEHPWNVDGELPPERARSHWTLHTAAWTMLRP